MSLYTTKRKKSRLEFCTFADAEARNEQSEAQLVSVSQDRGDLCQSDADLFDLIPMEQRQPKLRFQVLLQPPH